VIATIDGFFHDRCLLDFGVDMRQGGESDNIVAWLVCDEIVAMTRPFPLSVGRDYLEGNDLLVFRA
jgi:hypothetical protein